MHHPMMRKTVNSQADHITTHTSAAIPSKLSFITLPCHLYPAHTDDHDLSPRCQRGPMIVGLRYVSL
jgi:hypothetical protein